MSKRSGKYNMHIFKEFQAHLETLGFSAKVNAYNLTIWAYNNFLLTETVMCNNTHKIQISSLRLHQIDLLVTETTENKVTRLKWRDLNITDIYEIVFNIYLNI